MRGKKTLIQKLKKQLADVKREVARARQEKKEKEQQRQRDRFFSTDPTSDISRRRRDAARGRRGMSDDDRLARRIANLEIDETKIPSIKIRISEKKDGKQNQMNEAYKISEKLLSENSAKILEMKSTILEQNGGDGGEQASLEFLIDPETGQIRADASISPANAWSAAIVAVGGAVTATALIASANIAIAALTANPASALIVMTFTYLESRIFIDAIFRGISVLEKYGNKILSAFGIETPGIVKKFFEKIKGSPSKKAEQKIRDSIEKMIEAANLSEDEAKVFLIAVMEKVKSNKAYLELARDLAEEIAKNDLEKAEEVSRKINALNIETFNSLVEDAVELVNAADEIRDRKEPEEELAVAAESKQYNRWKSIAGVKE